MTIRKAAILILALACVQRCALTVLSADIDELLPAVVSVTADDGIGSGVCISDDGLILTAKHVVEHARSGAMRVVIDGRAVSAMVAYVPKQADGVAVLDAEGDGYQFAAVAESKPMPSDEIITIGRPAGSDQFDISTGRIVGGGHYLRVLGDYLPAIEGTPGSFPLNHLTVTTRGGWSGGPVFNSDGEVVCVLLGGEVRDRSLGSSYSQMIEAVAIAKATEPVRRAPADAANLTLVYAFTQPGCTPCEKFKRDNAAGAFSKHLRIEIHSAGSAGHAKAAAAYTAQTGKQIVSVPLFWAVGTSAEVVGYDNARALLKAFDAQRNGREIANPDRFDSVPADVSLFEPDGQPPAPPAPIETGPGADNAAELDWSGAMFLLLVSDGEHAVLRSVMPLVRSSIESATDHKAGFAWLSEHDTPEQFSDIEAAAELTVDGFGLLILVHKERLGLVKGIIARKIEGEITSQASGLSFQVRPIFERESKRQYRAIKAAIYEAELVRAAAGNKTEAFDPKALAVAAAQDAAGKLSAKLDADNRKDSLLLQFLAWLMAGLASERFVKYGRGILAARRVMQRIGGRSC